MAAEATGGTDRLWKLCRHRFAQRHGLTVTVAHYPPGASKWNPIEHRLFSEISKNWAGRPLDNYQAILNYLRTTRTKTGLEVQAHLLAQIYDKGRKVSDPEMRRLLLTRPTLELHHPPQPLENQRKQGLVAASALCRYAQSEAIRLTHHSTSLGVALVWRRHLEVDELGLCDQVRLEILWSARSSKDYDALAEELSALRSIAIDAWSFERALEVQRRLAHVGGLHHRSVKIADLIIAAAAEAAGATVLHYDAAFDRIAKVTGQPMRWIAQRGSL